MEIIWYLRNCSKYKRIHHISVSTKASLACMQSEAVSFRGICSGIENYINMVMRAMYSNIIFTRG
jgi:hypothetical protein